MAVENIKIEPIMRYNATGMDVDVGRIASNRCCSTTEDHSFRGCDHLR